jgi:hypothetical protein
MSMARNLRAPRHEHAVDERSALRYDPCEEISRRRVQTQAFFDAGNEEREVFARFFVLDGVRQETSFDCGVDFVLGAFVGRLVDYEEA